MSKQTSEWISAITQSYLRLVLAEKNAAFLASCGIIPSKSNEMSEANANIR